MWHGYFGIENLALNDAQRDTLVAALRALGPAAHRQPACLCHWRTRLDGQAAVFEALFDEDHLTVQAFTNRLAAIFGVDPLTIDARLSSATFLARPTPIAVFARASTDTLRLALFGGPAATWAESGAEARAYLSQYANLWETDTP